MTDSLSLITTVLRNHAHMINEDANGDYELRCSSDDWSVPIGDADRFTSPRDAYAEHRARVLRDALIAAGWREPGEGGETRTEWGAFIPTTGGVSNCTESRCAPEDITEHANRRRVVYIGPWRPTAGAEELAVLREEATT